MADKLQVSIVIEILGRPVENVKEALNTLVVKLGSEKGVNILSQNYNAPVPVKDTKDLFTAFAEITAELETVETFLFVILNYLPSHIEIISPRKINLHNFDLNDLGNMLSQRLHNYDAITKRMMVERDVYGKKLQEVAPQAFQELMQQFNPNNPTIKAPQSENQEPKKSKKKAKKS